MSPITAPARTLVVDMTEPTRKRRCPLHHRITIAVGLLVLLCLPGRTTGRMSGSEAAGATALKSGILPAEVQFQAADVVDAGGGGEYGFLTECSGLVPVRGQILNLLAPTYQSRDPLISGYHFTVFLPDGPRRALADPYPQPRHDDPATAAWRRRCWIAYSWPDDPRDGSRMFAIDQNGNIYSHPDPDCTAPAWDALYTHGWDSPVAPGWKPYRR